jgi:hypothetical protein
MDAATATDRAEAWVWATDRAAVWEWAMDLEAAGAWVMVPAVAEWAAGFQAGAAAAGTNGYRPAITRAVQQETVPVAPNTMQKLPVLQQINHQLFSIPDFQSFSSRPQEIKGGSFHLP